ncbi:MAG: 6-bladed beta-propeller [Sterolibacterium sp.]|nr:6-bladed beta-propeller [Sterolibacterium sp.]
MSPTKILSASLTGALLLAFVVLAGCVSAPVKAPVETEAVFYPSPPDPPRIQYLATFAGLKDLEGERSALADFVAGEDSGEDLKRPYGATIREGKIYVADNQLGGLAIFDLKAKQFSVLSGSGGGRMQRPLTIKIDKDGTRYVTDSGRQQVLVFDDKDNFVTTLGVKGEFKPVDTAILGDRLYMVDIEHHEVRVMDKRSGKLLFKFGKAGSGEGELYHPTNIAIGPDNDVFVVETSNFRVSRFTSEGKFVRSFGEAGQGAGHFARPKGIAVDRNGLIYVGDAAFQNVQIFDNSGRPLMAFGQPKDGLPGMLNLPAGVSIDYDNVALFRDKADPKFAIEYLILVVSQFGPNKVDVFGFGKKAGVDYPREEKSEEKPAK